MKATRRCRLNTSAFRAQRPAFDTDRLGLFGRATKDGAALWTTDADGMVGMTASARYR